MRIGIIGAGQLGQMLGFAARDLGFEVRFVDPAENPPAAVCGNVMQKQFDDPVALKALAETCDVITYEFENVPVDALQHIEGIAPVYPPASALRFSQDRVDEKQMFRDLDIPLADFHAVESRSDMEAAAEALGLPLVFKTRRFGYDGKGQFVARKSSDLSKAWELLGGQPLVAEQWVAFDYEISCIGVRSVRGEIEIYPLSRNEHINGILHSSRSPFAAAELESAATDYMNRLLQRLEYSGVLALELFVVGDQLMANEFAPRVHNSGHWTREACGVSQFEQQIRAVAGWPLGGTSRHSDCVMENLLGDEIYACPELAALPGAVVHDYGKATSRDGRKMGHVTRLILHK